MSSLIFLSFCFLNDLILNITIVYFSVSGAAWPILFKITLLQLIFGDNDN